MRKEDLGRGEVFQGAFKTIGQWIQERIFLLINMQAFNWASHLKHWILKMIVWYGMVGEEEQKKFRVRSQRPAGHTRILMDRANSNPQCSQIFQLNPNKNI